MNSVIEILEALESNNSRNYKEELLQKNKNNDLLKLIFVASGDPYVNYYVKKWKTPKPLEKEVSDDDKVVVNFVKNVLSDLSTRKVVGNEAKSLVEKSFRLMDVRQQKWCSRILLRNLRVGVMETTVNKIWPDAIAKFSVQLAESLGSRHEADKGIIITEKVVYPVRVEPKLDGLRCIAVKRDGEVTMFTRSGSVIETLPTIKSILESSDYDDFVLDGECLGQTWNDTASVMMSYKTAKDDSGMTYNVFDAMHFDDWKDQENNVGLKDRIDLVKDIVKKVNSNKVIQVSGETVQNEKELLRFYSDAMEKGYEGIMLKNLGASYAFKRSDAVLKLKPVSTFEGIIVGHYEGNIGSKREGMWGGFQVLMPNGVVTRCGGGFNDKIRAEIGIDPDSWIGRIVEIEGQPDPLTKDGLTQDGRVRFPVFVRVRDPRDVDSKIIESYNSWMSSSATSQV